MQVRSLVTEWMGITAMKRQTNFLYLLGQGVKSTFKHGFMSFAAVCITVACLLIMGTFTLVAVNANGLLEALNLLYSKEEVERFLETE